MVNNVGIVGVSPEGAALFCRQLSRHATRLLEPGERPAFSMHVGRLSEYIDAIRSDNWELVGSLLRASADVVRRAGAEVCVCPDSAVQHALQLASDGTIRWLSMTELVADRVSSDGRGRVGLIGTKLVMGGSSYQTHLGMRGVKLLTPETEEMDRIDQIIFGELLYGQVLEGSQRVVQSAVTKLAERGCEAVVLASSEVPLLLGDGGAELPLYDASDLLAEAAILEVKSTG